MEREKRTSATHSAPEEIKEQESTAEEQRAGILKAYSEAYPHLSPEQVERALLSDQVWSKVTQEIVNQVVKRPGPRGM